ncbi:hypothetical protein [Streptomonospora salina]|uniref:Uncharacterized protein n=1 Tax=Streptomonospora salina TaxID=104205 RepID=A0A841EFU4_9ACTN|nr:hypothetical protein [Streptomonospora salina]MBB6000209.1 hypothetical protein [Streptomonospora salina]
MPRSNLSPQHRAITNERALERRVAALERRTFAVPVLGEDPPADSVCNLWIVGSQLRYRDASGTVRRVATT